MHLGLSTLMATLLIARASAELYVIFQEQKVVLHSGKQTVIASQNVDQALAEITGEEEPMFQLLHFDKVTPDELSRIHPNLLEELTVEQRLELANQSHRVTKTKDEKIAPRIRRLRDWLAEALAGEGPSTLGEENMAMVQKHVKELKKMHPLTALLAGDSKKKFTPKFLRKVFDIERSRTSKSSEKPHSFDRLIDAVTDAFLGARDYEELYHFLNTESLPATLWYNPRVTQYVREYAQYLGDHEDVEQNGEGQGKGRKIESWTSTNFEDGTRARKGQHKEQYGSGDEEWNEEEDGEWDGEENQWNEDGEWNGEENQWNEDGEWNGEGNEEWNEDGEWNGEENEEWNEDGEWNGEENEWNGEDEEWGGEQDDGASNFARHKIPSKLTLNDPPKSVIESFGRLVGSLFGRKPSKPTSDTFVRKVPLTSEVEVEYEKEDPVPSRKPVLARWPHGNKGSKPHKQTEDVVESNEGAFDLWTTAKLTREPRSSPDKGKHSEVVVEDENDDQDEEENDDQDEEENDDQGEEENDDQDEEENEDEEGISKPFLTETWEKASSKKTSPSNKIRSKAVNTKNIKPPRVEKWKTTKGGSSAQQRDESASKSEESVGTHNRTPKLDESESGSDSESQSRDSTGNAHVEKEEEYSQTDKEVQKIIGGALKIKAPSSLSTSQSESDESQSNSEAETKTQSRTKAKHTAKNGDEEDENESQGQEDEFEEPNEESSSDGGSTDSKEYEDEARRVKKLLKKLEEKREKRQDNIRKLTTRREKLRGKLSETEKELKARQESLEKFLEEAHKSFFEDKEPEEGSRGDEDFEERNTDSQNMVTGDQKRATKSGETSWPETWTSATRIYREEPVSKLSKSKRHERSSKKSKRNKESSKKSKRNKESSKEGKRNKESSK